MSKYITVVFDTTSWTRKEREELSSREDVFDITYTDSAKEVRQIREFIKKAKADSMLVQVPGGGNAVMVPYWFIQEPLF